VLEILAVTHDNTGLSVLTYFYVQKVGTSQIFLLILFFIAH